MEVFIVSHCMSYEGATIVGIFSSYAKAHEYELAYIAKENLHKSEWLEVRKVELDKIYDDVFLGIGEEV